MRGFLLLVCMFYSALALQAQKDTVHSENSFFYIKEIKIEGNKRTKPIVILRELNFNVGDSIPMADWDKLLIFNQNNVLNTSLFNTVEVKAEQGVDRQMVVTIAVNERWYTFPNPVLELVDRNFNDWWQNNNHDFSRVNYGIYLRQNNVRGLNETLRMRLQAGYTKSFGVGYSIPQLSKSQRNGIVFEVSYSENNNIAYQTVEHKRFFVDRDYPIYSNFHAEMSYVRRRSLDFYQYFGASWDKNKVDEEVILLNPNYFENGALDQQYLTFTYGLRFDKRNVVYYPLKGWLFDFTARKMGALGVDDVNALVLFSRFSKYADLGRKFYLSNHSAAYGNFHSTLPYSNYSGLGYGVHYVRGYELYLIEGDQYFLNKTTFKKQIFSSVRNFSNVPLDQFRHFSIQVYLKAFFDTGYSRNFQNYSQNSILSNQWIYGGGLGFDFVTTYDIVMRTEFSVNAQGESGFFLHFKKEF